MSESRRYGEKEDVCLRCMSSCDRTLKQEFSSQIMEERLQQFLMLLHLGIDAQHSEVKYLVERLLEKLLAVIATEQVQLDVLSTRVKLLLLNVEASTTRLAIFSILPSTNLCSRSLQRRLAYDFLTDAVIDLNGSRSNDYSIIANIISSKSASVNPFLATKERDYLQVDANVQLLSYAFTDLAMQLLVSRDDPKDTESKPAKGALIRVIQNYYDYDDESAAFLRLLLPSSSKISNTENLENIKVNMKQVIAINKIMEFLQILSGQIHEGKGAFLDRSTVKDQLQRLHLMLRYQLADFGLLNGSKPKQDSHQEKLSKWFK